MANITRIKAQDPQKPQQKAAKTPQNAPKKAKTAKAPSKPASAQKALKTAKNSPKTAKTPAKTTKTQKKPAKTAKKTPLIAKPFVALGRYIKASWHELSLVRWPTRKYTWKMTAAMLVYCLFFLVLIVALDLLLSLIFNNLLK